MPPSSPQIGRKRLDSWKAIALFFGRDERTVNRWEKDLGLPVHRLPGTKGRVYAYTDELSTWLARPKNAGTTLGEQDSESNQANGKAEVAASGAVSIAGGHAPTRIESPEGRQSGEIGARSSHSSVRVLRVAIVVIMAVALILFYRTRSRSPKSISSIGSNSQQPITATVSVSAPSHNPDAEQLYLKGRYYWSKRTPEDLNRALDYFMQAVVHDPNYAEAYVGMADCYNLMREYTLMSSSEAYPRALAAAKKAVELDAQSSDAHAALAFVSFFGMWDVSTGEREFRRAVELNPNNPAAHHWYANALMALRRFPEALAEIERAQSLDPASTAILADKGNILFHAGQRDEALSLLKQMETREPTFRSPHVYLTNVYLAAGDYPNFISELRKDAVLVHDDSATAIAAAAAKGFATAGARGMFEAMLQVQEKFYALHSASPIALAQTFARLGNKREAVRYLNDAYQQRDSSLLFVEVYPEYDVLADEPGYRALLARMNLPVQKAP